MLNLPLATVWEGVKLADGAEVLKGLELLKMVEGRHTPACACDECLRYKSKLSPIPDGRTDRPRRTERRFRDALPADDSIDAKLLLVLILPH